MDDIVQRPSPCRRSWRKSHGWRSSTAKSGWSVAGFRNRHASAGMTAIRHIWGTLSSRGSGRPACRSNSPVVLRTCMKTAETTGTGNPQWRLELCDHLIALGEPAQSELKAATLAELAETEINATARNTYLWEAKRLRC